FIAAAVFDEAKAAFGASAFESGGAGGFDGGAEFNDFGFEAGVRVAPGFGAVGAGEGGAGG
ncbi:MAG: hypothetical protein Q9198_008516, partial [Flavoplaca austrocitrina]